MLYQTHAQVHLGNIRRNIEAIRTAVGADRKMLIAVKANAYGHGAVEVSRMAQKAGVDWLGVATVPEGMELRQAGIRLPILKLSPLFPEEMEAAFSSDIAIAVCERGNIRAAQDACKALGLRGNVHLKVDTGMGRVGCTPEDAPAIALFIEKNCPNLNVQGVFTHFPVSDEGDPSYTRAQFARFKAVVEAVNEAIGRRVELAHCSNSGAVLAHPEAWLDMVRPGIMIYGHYPDAETPQSIPLQPGMSIATRLSCVKKVSKGTDISYGRTWSAPRDTWVGTIPAGYADGFNRLFSSRGRVLVNGRSCPIIGRVCMDQSMVDLGPDAQDKVGDQVVLMGEQGGLSISCEEWAKVLGTITYEVTCQISPRVSRVYDED
ncbi:MAG TPA: alanine racemase [Spirochaetales bacterium]|nr:alanine racemase [Spirochaetales bacterium]